MTMIVERPGTERWWVISTTPRPHYPRERSKIHCTGSWVFFGDSVGYMESLDTPFLDHWTDQRVGSSANYAIPAVYIYIYTQGVYKRMVRFQKLIRNLLLTLHGHNVHRQQRKLSKFLMRYQQFASHA